MVGRKLLSMEERLWTISQLAEYLSVPVSTIHRWHYRGEIKALKIGRHLRFRESDIEDFLRRAERRSRPQGGSGWTVG